MPLLTPRYAPELVAASSLIATFASYVSLDLAARVRTQDRAAARAWWAGGSVAMGTGICAMHYSGMAAAGFPEGSAFLSANELTGEKLGNLVVRSVARIGGEKFVLLMDEVPELADAATLADRLLTALAEPIKVGDQPLQISASVGIAIHPDHAAATALRFFESHMDAKAQ